MPESMSVSVLFVLSGMMWMNSSGCDSSFALSVRPSLCAAVVLSAPAMKAMRAPPPMTTGVYGLPTPAGTAVLVPDALLVPPVGIGSRGGGCLGLSVSPRRRPARSAAPASCESGPPRARRVRLP